MDGKVLPCRGTVGLRLPAPIPFTDLPAVAASRPVDIQDMVFPRPFALQRLLGVVNEMVEIAVTEWTLCYFRRSFSSTTPNGGSVSTGGAVDRAKNFLVFHVVTLIVVWRGRGSKFYSVLVNCQRERGWGKSEIISGNSFVVSSDSLLLLASRWTCQVTGNENNRETDRLKKFSNRQFRGVGERRCLLSVCASPIVELGGRE